MNADNLFIKGIVGVISERQIFGYLPTHYKFRNNLNTGLRNSFFIGSKQTELTTVDNKAPVETFITNRNTLRVAASGRKGGEPILTS